MFGNRSNRNHGQNSHRSSRNSGPPSNQNRGRENNRNNNDDNREQRRNNSNNRNDRNRGNDSRSNQNRLPRKLGFKKLQDLLDDNDLEEIVFFLSSSRSGFKELLEEKKISSDMLVLLIKVINKICDCSFDSPKTSILLSVVQSAFPDSINAYLFSIPIQSDREKQFNKYFWNNTDEFWYTIINISKKLYELVPSSSVEILLKLLRSVKMVMPLIEEQHTIHISDGIKKDVVDLLNVVEEAAKKNEEKKIKKPIRSKTNGVQSEMEPPNDFRELSIYPSSGEITTDEQAFLRKNVIEGPYRDVNHYLDVHFRLLRQDFVIPLQKGICKYLEDPKSKPEDIRVYKKIKFLNAEVCSEQNCYKIQYDFSKKKRSFEYERSKMFMFGSLLLFTQDNFKNIIFAKVAQRDLALLQNGQLIVGLDVDVNLPQNLYDVEFLMVESKVFFEPYYQVLNVLRTMETTDFPMERYIIQVSKETKPPEYLLKIDPVFYNIDNTAFFWPLNWQNRRFYNLNDAQQEAFEAALTKEFVIIQGPPGTGKTFLGLKIVETLLRNKQAWYNNSPILVICYTNHALDQFLEGLIPVTDELIRVGGQCKNQKVAAFNIRNLRSEGGKEHQSVWDTRRKLKECRDRISAIDTYLKEIENLSSVIDFQNFKEVPSYHGSWFYNADSKNIMEWLFEQIEDRSANYKPNVVTPQNEENDTSHENEEETEESFDEHHIDLDDELFASTIKVDGPSILISVKSLEKDIRSTERHLNNIYEEDQLSPWERNFQINSIQNEIYKMTYKLDYLKYRLAYSKQMNNRVPPDDIDLIQPYKMCFDSRWKLYFYWLFLYEEILKGKKDRLVDNFRDVFRVYTDMTDMESTQIMKKKLVIGMTTVGAARIKSSLQALKSSIVIVEEAAEVLEAHIIAALTKHCQHLILIGDHQQLKPSTANFKVETRYLLGISLFERMVLNNIQCYTLNIQHRMRPEIANLIRPTIYPVLHDHASVLERPHIKGVTTDLFFIDHHNPEEVCGDNSKKNIHESKFLIQLAKRLVLNGYEQGEIIILAAYLGQMFELQREKRIYSNILQNVRIAVLDNYQGEESDIVLLSLVRSNAQQKIGFLSIENRVCVALSRARNGLFIMGNMGLLCKKSQIWPEINKTLINQKAIDSSLTLRCEIHRTKIIRVRNADDFLQFPEGGCDLICDVLLNCGHNCKRLCHIVDREHEEYNCQEDCNRLLCDDPKHVCNKKCYEVCGPCKYPVQRALACGHIIPLPCHEDPDTHVCIVPVDTDLPCGHNTPKPCNRDPATFKCPFPCDTRVEPCGHACVRLCHINNDPDHLQYKCYKKCERLPEGCTNDPPHVCPKYCHEECPVCLIEISKRRTKCEHMYKVACSYNPDDIICERPCKKNLPCGHKCKKKCSEPCGGCAFIVSKPVPDCKHIVKIKCSETPTKKHCSGICPRPLPCGHPCGKKCLQTCETECKKIVDCSITSPCGHIIKKIMCCFKNNYTDEILLKQCREHCRTELQCKHKCQGTCGQCYQGRVHQRCQEKCGVPLVCNHECPIPCREACQPCEKQCSYRCAHNKCTKKCGELCTPCKESCKRRCKHQNCTRKCGEICSVDPCTYTCERQLKCGHQCVGFCGDPCPPLCRICNKEELQEIFFGTEDEDDAVFVLLKDCGHIMESTGLESWLEQDENQIKPKVCPKCKTVIVITERYSDYIKQNMIDLHNVKIRFIGDPKEIDKERHDLKSKLQKLIFKKLVYGIPDLLTVLKKLINRLETTKNSRAQRVNKMVLDSIRMESDLIHMMVEIGNDIHIYPLSKKQISFIVKFIDDIKFVSQQRINDLISEVNRLRRFVEFEKMDSKNYCYLSDVKEQFENVTGLLNSVSKYTTNHDNLVKTGLEKLKVLTKSKVLITEAERQVIVKAMELTKGHWYKCANGHPYAIGECGGAMQQSKCLCGAPIGGSSHRLLSDNSVATEMDGARFGAWSEQANMANYEL